MADISGFSSAIRLMTEIFSDATDTMALQKSPWKRSTASKFKIVAKLFEAFRKHIDIYNDLPKPRRHVEGSKIHATLEKLVSPLEDISKDFEGLVNRQKLGAVRRRIAAFIRSREFCYGAVNVPEHLPDAIDKSVIVFSNLASTLTKPRTRK